MHGDIIVEFNIDPLKIAGAIWSQKYPPLYSRHHFGALQVSLESRDCTSGDPASTVRETQPKRRQLGPGGGGEGEPRSQENAVQIWTQT